MLYLSRAEQAALLLLLALLLAGGGLLVYSRGHRAGRADADLPLFVDAPNPAPGGLTREGLPSSLVPKPRSGGRDGGPLKAGLATGQAGGQPGRSGAAGAGPGSPRPGRKTRESTGSAPGQSSPAAAHRQAAKPSPISRLPLNSATANQLDVLPGIGPVLAQRIVQYREQLKRQRGHGFESVDELLNVPGIGPKRLAAVRDLVTL